MREWSSFAGVVGFLVVSAGLGCQSANPESFDHFDDGPGSDAWGSANVTCNVDDDCLTGEMCLSGVCQLSRCNDGPYFSAPPIGNFFELFSDSELVVADSQPYQGQYYVDGYTQTAGSVEYGGSWETGSAPLLDVVSANFVANRPDEIAVARAGSTQVDILGGAGKSIDTGVEPVALASADTQATGTHDLVAVSDAGEIRVCHADECEGFQFESSVTALDIAGGDVDGDGRDEVMVLITFDGAYQVIGLNLDYETTGQPLSFGDNVPPADRISIGDLDGDRIDELITLDDDGCGLFGCGNDTVRTYRVTQDTFFEIDSRSVDDNTVDVEVEDLDRDQFAEIVLLREGRAYRVLDGNLNDRFAGALTVESDPRRLSLGDFDGDSPAGRLVKGPEMLPGNIVPIMVAHFPPYSREYSDGRGSVFVGDGQTSSETFTDTVSMSAGITAGVQGDFLGLFKSDVSFHIREHLSMSQSETTSINVGDRFSIEADPDRFGPDYAGVYVTTACYHTYTYRMDDPAGWIGGDGSEFVMIVPVEGRTTIWSSHRYNALAPHLGLPYVDVPHSVGDVASYPTQPRDANGDIVPGSAMVFPEVPTYTVSDIGKVGAWLSVSNTTTNDINLDVEVGVSSSVAVPGFKVGSELGVGWGQGYSISMGDTALFGGGVPPLMDDPSTPEDEYVVHSYSFSPYVYQQEYTDAAGQTASFYVYDFVVGQ